MPLTNYDFQWGRSEVVVIYPDDDHSEHPSAQSQVVSSHLGNNDLAQSLGLKKILSSYLAAQTSSVPVGDMTGYYEIYYEYHQIYVCIYILYILCIMCIYIYIYNV